MSNCDDKEKLLRRLILEEKRLDARLQRTAAQVYLNKSIGENMAEDIKMRMDNQELLDLVKRSFEGENVRVDIGEGQPTNFNILMREHTIETAGDYARLQAALLGKNRTDDLGYAKEMEAVYGTQEVLQTVLNSYQEFMPKGQALISLISNTAAFSRLAEKMTSIRYVYETARNNLMDTLDTMAQFKLSTAKPVTKELKQRFSNDAKIALIAERHVDYAKRKTGQTLRSLQDSIEDPEIDRLGELFRSDDYWNIPDSEIDDVIGVKESDFTRDHLVGKVREILDGTDRVKTADQLHQIRAIIKTDGVDPKSRLGANKYANLLRLRGNALIKDSQLFNFRTLFFSNPMPNFQMALVGPIRTAIENGHRLSVGYGTKTSRNAYKQGQEIAFSSYKTAMDLTRHSFKELLSDAAVENKAFYGGYKDSNLLGTTSNEELISQLHQQMDKPLPPGGLLTPDGWLDAAHKFQAAFRLKVWDITKNPFLLSPGFRGMAAPDNVVGYYHHVFKRKNELEIQARLGVEGVDLATEAQRAEWVAMEFDKGFNQLEPTELEIITFRRKHGIKFSAKTNDEVANIITSTRVSDTYGAPINNDFAGKAADDYSREMRSQGEFKDYGGLGQNSTAQAINKAVIDARKDFRVDFVIPYWQSAISGNLLAMDQIFIGPLVNSFFPGPNRTAEQIAKVKANWIISSGFLGIWAGLLALDPDLIIGNGPVDPNDRQEWLIRLRAKGQVPNSIAGVQMPAGFLDPLFFFTDIHEAVTYGNLSESDQNIALRAASIALTGRLMRQTSFSQIKVILDLLLDPTKTTAQRFAQSVGYIVGGTVPGIGVYRTAERFNATTQQDFFTDNGPSPRQDAKGYDDAGILGNAERFMENFLLGASPGLSRLTGSSAYKETDWLGSDISLPFGTRMVKAYSHRFYPQLHPNDRVYVALDKHNILEPPSPLYNQTLQGVPMSAKLQKLYNDTYSSVKGEADPTARLKLSGSNPSIKLDKNIPIDIKEGIMKGARFNKKINIVSLPITPFIKKHVEGKVAIDAFRSILNDPTYKEIENNDEISGLNPSQLASERKTKAGTLILKTIKTYYELLTEDQLNLSSDPEAKNWRKQRNRINVKNFEQLTENFRSASQALNRQPETQNTDPQQTLRNLPGN